MSNTWMIYAGIAIGVAAMAGVVVYGPANQQHFVKDDVVLAPSATQGAFSSESGWAQLNKEKWHEEPFGDIAKKVREQSGK